MNKTCPICGKKVAQSSESFPFCSSRCQMVDLGNWLGEDYRVSLQDESVPEQVPDGNGE